jgi:diacylglycerol kinase (ATP)
VRKNLSRYTLEAIEEAGYEASTYATTPEPDSAKNEATRAAEG